MNQILFDTVFKCDNNYYNYLDHVHKWTQDRPIWDKLSNWANLCCYLSSKISDSILSYCFPLLHYQLNSYLTQFPSDYICVINITTYISDRSTIRLSVYPIFVVYLVYLYYPFFYLYLHLHLVGDDVRLYEYRAEKSVGKSAHNPFSVCRVKNS